MASLLRRFFGAGEPPRFASRQVRRQLEAAVLQVWKGVERAMIDQRLEAAAKSLRHLPAQESRGPLLAALVRGEGIEAAAPDRIRVTLCLAELTVAFADALDCQDPTLVPPVIAELCGLLQLPDGADFGRTLQSLHGEAVAAMLPDGWQEPAVDMAQFRDECWGVRAGNRVAAWLLGEGRRATEALPESLAEAVGRDLLGRGIDPPPLPSDRLPLPRRHPERWMQAAAALGAEPRAVSLRGRAEAAEACLRHLLDGAFADRLEDLLLNGAAPDPAPERLAIPPAVGLLVIDMAAHATGHHQRLQPAAEVEAARLAVAVFGLGPREATAAARRWGQLWEALMERYAGRATPLIEGETDYALLALAQTRGRKLGEFIKSGRNLDAPAETRPPEAEARAVARLFRFAEALPPRLSLPSLGDWPAPPRAAAAAALRQRFIAARLTDVRATRLGAGEETAVTRRLAQHFRLLDRLLPWPEYSSTEQLPSLMQHFGTTDPAAALEQIAVSIALREPAFTVFLAALCLEAAADAQLPAAEARALFRLSLERVQPGSATLLKVIPREQWLALADEESLARFALAEALRGGEQPDPGDAAGPETRAAVALAARLAEVLRAGAMPDALLLAEVEERFVVTPARLRR